MSHTPGPWVRFDYRVFTLTTKGHVDKHIATTASNAVTRTPEAEANARLIAAAPDLLAAATVAFELLARLDAAEDSRRFWDERVQLAAAIAKAEE